MPVVAVLIGAGAGVYFGRVSERIIPGESIPGTGLVILGLAALGAYTAWHKVTGK